ncbi:MAG TPA: 30S ribosomal protein S17 [Patescibacteria group bacterium]|nr:30S ribosomal protein S17 [Patescibacteria group bacterium]
MEQEKTPSFERVRRTLRGTVVSDRMQKTLVVQVDRTVLHPKYGKRYVRSHRYKIHDERGEGRMGDVVEFTECRPLSREKRWRLLRKVS